MTAWDLSFHHAIPHGVVSGVLLPATPDPVPEPILERLPPAELQHALTLRGFRQVEYVGGRLALRLACQQLGVNPPALLCDERGAPVLPRGLVGSVSHKRELAVGMVARDHLGTLGVDLEDYEPARPAIVPKVLLPEEIGEVESLPEERRWYGVLLRFCIKEAIYKALDPWVHRYVGFHEALVRPDIHGRAEVELRLVQQEGPFSVSARYEWLEGRVLASVRIRPATAA